VEEKSKGELACFLQEKDDEFPPAGGDNGVDALARQKEVRTSHRRKKKVSTPVAGGKKSK